MKDLNVLIYGTGAVGIYIGGRLSKAGFNTVFVDLPKKVSKIRDEGLHIQSVIDNDYILVPDMPSIFPYLRRDIPPGENEEIDIVAKYDNEEECYGWPNDSYKLGWRPEQWKLTKGRYIIKIEVIASGYRLFDVFRVVNDVGMSDFRLEKANKEDKAVLVSD